MGFSLSCLRQESSSSTQRLADQQETKHGNRSACSGMSFMVMLGCLWTKETEQKQLRQVEEKQQKQQQVEKAKDLTLEDWLIDSPGFLQKNNGISVGEYHVFRHSSKRVFPSFVREMANSSCNNPRESFSKEKLKKPEDDHVQSEEMEVCLSRSQSGKSKKKVSFRLPEEADIFIFHSSPVEEEPKGKEI
ncbi:hypothetical protein PTKIN_Ptkin11bG0187800 [Pterospermum kingtungense]